MAHGKGTSDLWRRHRNVGAKEEVRGQLLAQLHSVLARAIIWNEGSAFDDVTLSYFRWSNPVKGQALGEIGTSATRRTR